jgi:hypothetical protein
LIISRAISPLSLWSKSGLNTFDSGFSMKLMSEFRSFYQIALF